MIAIRFARPYFVTGSDSKSELAWHLYSNSVSWNRQSGGRIDIEESRPALDPDHSMVAGCQKLNGCHILPKSGTLVPHMVVWHPRNLFTLRAYLEDTPIGPSSLVYYV